MLLGMKGKLGRVKGEEAIPKFSISDVPEIIIERTEVRIYSVFEGGRTGFRFTGTQ